MIKLMLTNLALGLGKGLAKLDALTGNKASKFLMKNGAKIIGSAIHKTSKFIGKPQWSEKLGRGIDKINDVAKKALGNDNVIVKNLNNMSSEAKGQRIAWNFDNVNNNNNDNNNNNNNPNSTALATPTGFYNKNLGGSNFKRFTPKRNKFKRVRFPKFVQKKVKKHKF